MAFWKDGDAQPKRNFRFKVEIAGSTWWWAKTCDTPSFDVGEVEVNYLDNKFYYPGRVSWNEVNMSVVDPISEDVTSKVSAFLESMNYIIKGTTAVNGTISKVAAVRGAIPPLGVESQGTGGTTVVITIFDAGSAGDGKTGAAVEKWTLNNAWLKSAKFGTLDYSNDELKQVDLVWRYDWATLDDTSGTDKFVPQAS